MPLHRPIPLAAVIALPLLLSGSGIAAAQEPSTAASAPAAVVKPPTYAEALSVLAWDVNRRGPLIAPVTVTPRRVAPNGFAEALQEISPAELPPLADARRGAGYTPESVLARYDKASHRFGGVTAFGPAVQIEYQDHLPNRPDLNADGRRTDMTRHLLATLNDTQWRQITSKQGLGIADLSAQQRPLWKKIVPQPFTYTHVTLTRPETPFSRPEPGGFFITDFGRKDTPPISLSEEARAEVHIRVKWLSSAAARRTGNQRRFPVIYKKNLNERYLPYFELAEDAKYQALGVLGTLGSEYGAELVRRLPAHPKPSDIAFEGNDPSLAASVSLSPEETAKPLTVGVLVQRIAAATDRELYADQRIAKLPVVTRGDTAPANDALAALAFGLSGAVRRVGPDSTGCSAYVLTRDQEPLGAEQARIDDWALDGSRMARSDRDAENRRIAKHNPLPLLSFDSDDPMRLTPSQTARFIAACRSRDNNTMLEMRPEELPSDQRQLIQDTPWYLGQFTPIGEDPDAPLDRVWVGGQIWLGLVVPGVGEITDISVEGQPANWLLPEPETLGDILAGRALAVRAESVTEATEAVAEAKRVGAAALWMEAAPDSLAAAVTAGKAAGLPITAVVRLLTVPLPGGTPDINVLGETSAVYAKRRWNREVAPLWYSPDDPVVRTAALERLRNAAAVPGIAAVVVRDAVPPGYRAARKADTSFYSIQRPGDASSYQDGAAAQLGYSTAHRLAFLREKSIDPADIIPDTYVIADHSGEGSMHERSSALLFRTGGAAADTWAVWRRALAQSLLADARTTVRTTAPALPILLAGRTTWSSSVGAVQNLSAEWFTSWPDALQDAPDIFLPSPELAPPTAAMLLPSAKKSGTGKDSPSFAKAWLALSGPDASLSPTDLLRQAGEGWDGFVFDLSYLPWPEAKKRLAAMEAK